MRQVYKAIIGSITAIAISIGVYSGYTWLNQDPLHNPGSVALRVGDDRITQIDHDNDSSVIFGAIADIHGEADRANHMGRMLKERGAEFILVAGDVANNEALRSGMQDRVPDHQEIRTSLEALAKTGLPIFAIPGNHERRDDWEDALALVTSSYPNVIDMARYRVLDGEDVDVVSLPGYHIREDRIHRFIPDGGFFASAQMIQEAGELALGLDDAVFLLAHAAGKTGSPGPATISSGIDVGDELTTQMMRDAGIRFAVVGHIHEAAGLAARLDGTLVLEGEWSDEFILSAGTLLDWRMLDGTLRHGTAALVTVDNNRAQFEMIYLE